MRIENVGILGLCKDVTTIHSNELKRLNLLTEITLENIMSRIQLRRFQVKTRLDG